MRITELLPSAIVSDEAKDLAPKHLTANPRQITAESLFFLTEGVKYDKHRLIPYILSKRPMAIVLPIGAREDCGDVPIVYAHNLRRCFSEALARFYGLEKTKMKFIGVTGTNGKTTTATMLFGILKSEGMRVALIGTGQIIYENLVLAPPFYSMTTPDPELLYPTLAKIEENGCEFVVMEISSHAIALEKIAPLHFSIGIFTNLSAEHLDFHKTIEDYYQTKARLFSQTDLAIINADDPYGRRLAAHCPCQSLTTGSLYEGDVMARNVEDYGLAGCRFMYKSRGPAFFVHLKFAGLYQIYNAMPAIAAAIALGIPPCKARHAIEEQKEIKGRMECVSSEDVAVYLDYAHTPEALRSALRNAKEARAGSRMLWLIFGCGGERDRQKRPEMARIAQEGADRVILTLDNCRSEAPMQILKDACRGFVHRDRVRIISNRARAIRTAILSMHAGDTLIVAGKGNETYTVDKKGYHPFDERKIIADALKERKGGHTVLYENQADSAADGQGN